MADENTPKDPVVEFATGAMKALGGNLGTIIESTAAADSRAKFLAQERLKSIINSGNSEMVTTTSILGLDEDFSVKTSVPNAFMADLRSFVPKSMKFTADFNMETHDEDQTRIEANSAFEAQAKMGFGLYSVSAKVTGSASVANERKRSTDKRATIHYEVEMEQAEPPEAVSRIVDGQMAALDASVEINKTLAQMIVESRKEEIMNNLTNKVENGEKPPEEEN